MFLQGDFSLKKVSYKNGFLPFIGMDWKDITVGQFLDLYKLGSNKELDEMGKLEEAVSIIYSKTPSEVEAMSMGEFTEKSKTAGRFLTGKIPGKAVRTIKVGSRRYRINYDPTRLAQRQYVEVVHFGSDPIENMHMIMASVVQPVKWGITRKNKVEDHGKIAEDMLQARVIDVYHTCVFFCNLYKTLMLNIRGYLVSEIMKTGRMNQKEAENLIMSSINAMDGFTTQQGLQNTNE